MTRTTFFQLEIVGPSVPYSAVDAQTIGTDGYAEMSRLWERAKTMRFGHRAGVWKHEALNNLARRSGATLVRAYSINRDSKGFIESSQREIV